MELVAPIRHQDEYRLSSRVRLLPACERGGASREVVHLSKAAGPSRAWRSAVEVRAQRLGQGERGDRSLGGDPLRLCPSQVGPEAILNMPWPWRRTCAALEQVRLARRHPRLEKPSRLVRANARPSCSALHPSPRPVSFLRRFVLVVGCASLLSPLGGCGGGGRAEGPLACGDGGARGAIR